MFDFGEEFQREVCSKLEGPRFSRMQIAYKLREKVKSCDPWVYSISAQPNACYISSVHAFWLDEVVREIRYSRRRRKPNFKEALRGYASIIDVCHIFWSLKYHKQLDLLCPYSLDQLTKVVRSLQRPSMFAIFEHLLLLLVVQMFLKSPRTLVGLRLHSRISEAWLEIFKNQAPPMSEVDVADTLSEMGLVFHHQVNANGFFVDFTVEIPRQVVREGKLRTETTVVAIECDGPTHFLDDDPEKGYTRKDILREKLVREVFPNLVRINFKEWQALSWNEKRRKQFLSSILGIK